MTTTAYNKQYNIIELEISAVNSIIESDSNHVMTALLWPTYQGQGNYPQKGFNTIVNCYAQSNPYYLNKYGEDYACCGDLGFVRSYMSPGADRNHIF